jgi:hypothetical protein
VRRLAVAFGIVLTLAGSAQAEFVARARDFKCLKAFTPVPGKSFVVYNRNPIRLRRAIEIAANDLRHKRYPIGTIVQVFPFEAMVKRGGGFNPSGGGWEFFNLKVTPTGTRIVGRTATQPAGQPLRNFFGACQDIRCHGALQVRPYDHICEGHLPPLSLTDAEFQALRADPRCP